MTTFKDYKEAILAHYKIVKTDDVTGILRNPTPAQLRDFCVLKLDGIRSADESVFKAFFEVKKEADLKRSIERSNIDKFKPIISFLKEQNDPDNSIRVELTAIIIDFNTRPFTKFSGFTIENTIEKVNNTTIISRLNSSAEQPKKRFKWSVLLLGFIGLFGIGYTAKDVFLPQKECMQWQNDHYELLDCNLEVNGFIDAQVLPIDEAVVNLKSVKITDTTTFFKGGKALIWYCKVDGVPAYFDGPGFHPVTGKALRPITKYIIKKYINVSST